MRKEFLQFDTVRDNAIKLAHKIYSEGFIPDVIYVAMRGGAPLGNVISEYFKVVLKREHPVYYATVVARSYSGVATAGEIKMEGWSYPPERLRIGDKVLLADDIFDSGNTINHLARLIMDRGISRDHLKIAVHDYKYFTDKEKQHPVQPDYFCRRHDLSVHDEPYWIHYMSHELAGLTWEEAQKHYHPDLHEALKLATGGGQSS
ncbi:MAG: phosphoribosyltransferase [Spirochaetes bacterium]|nr:phosphoribosyltransferase [Spirochaetota bacterium]